MAVVNGDKLEECMLNDLQELYGYTEEEAIEWVNTNGVYVADCMRDEYSNTIDYLLNLRDTNGKTK